MTRVGVEAVVRDRLEHHAPAQLLRQRGADVVGLLAEARQRGLVVRLRYAERDDAVVDRQGLRLLHRGARRRRQLRAGSRPTRRSRRRGRPRPPAPRPRERRQGCRQGWRQVRRRRQMPRPVGRAAATRREAPGRSRLDGDAAPRTTGHSVPRAHPRREASGAGAAPRLAVVPRLRSSRSTRSASACTGVPASRRASRTSAISSTRRGSAASVPRMSTTA